MNTSATEHDCGSDKYLAVAITQERANQFLQRSIFHNNALLMLTEKNLPDFIGQIVQMRTPIYCRNDRGCCRICTGPLDSELPEIFSALHKEHVIQIGILRLRSAKHFQNPEDRLAEVAAVRESLREIGIDLN